MIGTLLLLLWCDCAGRPRPGQVIACTRLFVYPSPGRVAPGDGDSDGGGGAGGEGERVWQRVCDRRHLLALLSSGPQKEGSAHAMAGAVYEDFVHARTRIHTSSCTVHTHRARGLR